MLGDFSARINRGDILKQTTGNENSHEITNGDDFSTFKDLIFKSTIFSHRNINKLSGTSPDGNTCKNINHNVVP
jgi:hypothetical protein